MAKDLLAREVDASSGNASARYSGPPPRRDEAPPSGEEPSRARTRDRRRRDRRTRARGESAERELVRVMLHERGEVDGLAERIDPAEFQNAELREIFQALVHLGDGIGIEELSSVLTPAAVEEMQALLEEPDALVDIRRTIDDSLAKLRVRDIEGRMEEIDGMMKWAAGEEKDVLTAEKMKLQREKQALGGKGFQHFGKSRS